MILRPRYLDTLRTYRDVPLVKILPGIRRSGKSTILEMLGEELVASGISGDHIISMRYTSENFEEGMTSKEMYQGIKEKITGDARYYLLLDEVQEVFLLLVSGNDLSPEVLLAIEFIKQPT